MNPTNKFVKILLLLGSISWIVVLPLFIGFFVYLINTAPSDPKLVEGHLMKYAVVVNFFGFLYTIFMTALQVFFIAHAARNQELEMAQSRTRWLVTIIFLGGLAMPFYWLWYIWPDQVPMFGTAGLDTKRATGI